jgi:hypothetical protein
MVSYVVGKNLVPVMMYSEIWCPELVSGYIFHKNFIYDYKYGVCSHVAYTGGK